mgnify:CR=1 FL=1
MRATASFGKIDRPMERGVCRLSLDGENAGICVLSACLTISIDFSNKDGACGSSKAAADAVMRQLLTAMRLTFDRAFSLLGKVTVSTPFLKLASALASSTS